MTEPLLARLGHVFQVSVEQKTLSLLSGLDAPVYSRWKSLRMKNAYWYGSSEGELA